MNAGLFVMNPDSSDDDEPHRAVNGANQGHVYNHAGGPHQVSPQRSSPARNSPQHSSPRASPVGQVGTTSRNPSTGATPLPPIPSHQSGSSASNSHHSLPSATSSASPSAPHATSRPLPIVNAPNSNASNIQPLLSASHPILPMLPLGSPLLSAFPLPSPSGQEMALSLSQNSNCNGASGNAAAGSARPTLPQPPPQPERHRDFGQKPRALTTPSVERDVLREARGTNSAYREQPGSPSRALPPLPSKAQSVPSPTVGHLKHESSPKSHLGYFHPPHLFPPTPSSVTSGSSVTRGSSPDNALHVPDRRPRSNSMLKVLLQVTIDNDAFSVVDITGVNTAEAIRERIFSKVSAAPGVFALDYGLMQQLRFRDDDYPTLSLFRTDIGEQPEPTPISHSNLLQLCQTLGDSRASLKFLVKQTHAPRSSSSMVPPPSATDFTNQDPPAIVTEGQAPRYTPDAHSGGHSKDGSLSSASGVSMDHCQGSFHSLSDAEDLSIFGTRSLRQPTLSTSSASPISGNTSHPSLHANPNLSPVRVRAGSISTPDLTRNPLDSDSTYQLPPSVFPANSHRDLSATIRANPSPAPAPPPVANAFPVPLAGPSSASSPSASYPAATPGFEGVDRATLDEMDEETKALVLQMTQEDQQRLAQRQEQLRADAQLALRTQETEREHWHRDQIRRQSELDQLANDAAEAVSAQRLRN